jgi:hypothetical protein
MKQVRGNLFIDGDPWLKGFLGLDWFPSDAAKLRKRRYEEWIPHLINEISRQATGCWLLSEIQGASHKVIVKPWIPDPEATAAQNAQGLPYGKPKDYAAASPSGIPGKPADIDHLDQLFKRENIGTGAGSDFVIWFTPWWYVGPGRRSGPAFDPDELLYHELVHAMNSVRGVLRVTGRAATGFDDLDEFCAITLTNTYSAQTGRRLRWDHQGHQLLPAALCNDAAFYAKYDEYVNAVNKYHPNLVKIYQFWANDKAFLPFNPFGPATTKTLPDL